MSETKRPIHVFTLTTKKTVSLKEPTIATSRTAAQIAGKKAGDNQAYLNMLIQEEVAKLLIHQIDGEIVPATKKENLDNLFKMNEYGQVLKAIQMIGGDEGEPVMAIDTTGA